MITYTHANHEKMGSLNFGMYRSTIYPNTILKNIELTVVNNKYNGPIFLIFSFKTSDQGNTTQHYTSNLGIDYNKETGLYDFTQKTYILDEDKSELKQIESDDTLNYIFEEFIQKNQFNIMDFIQTTLFDADSDSDAAGNNNHNNKEKI